MEAKRWGPFSGLQLTIIAVAVLVAVILPVGAWATLTFSNVAITDPGGVNQATVDSSHNLHTAVTGSVFATETPPNATFNRALSVTGSSCVMLATPPAGKAIVVADVHVSETAGSFATPPVLTVGIYKGSSTCASGQADAPTFNKAGQNANLSYPSGFPLANGVSLFVKANDAAAHYFVSVHGYLVAASMCTTGC